jgi:hypothetical protein
VARFGLLIGFVSLALAIYSFVDCLQRPAATLRVLPKPVWALLILLFPLLGSVSYLLVGRGMADSLSAKLQHPSAAPSGPDDDEAYLRRLRERAQEQRDEYRRQQMDKKLDEWEAQFRDESPGGTEAGPNDPVDQ